MNWRIKLAVVFGLAVAWMSPVVARTAASPVLWLYLGAAVLVLGAAGLGVLWHVHTLAYRESLAPLQGWTKVGAKRWACPFCAAEVTGWQARKHHAEAETSPCAAFQAHLALATEAAREVLPGAGWPAVLEGEHEQEEVEV